MRDLTVVGGPSTPNQAQTQQVILQATFQVTKIDLTPTATRSSTFTKAGWWSGANTGTTTYTNGIVCPADAAYNPYMSSNCGCYDINTAAPPSVSVCVASPCSLAAVCGSLRLSRSSLVTCDVHAGPTTLWLPA